MWVQSWSLPQSPVAPPLHSCMVASLIEQVLWQALLQALRHAVVQAENAALLSTLLMIKAEALEVQGRVVEAQAVRRDSLGWARYGFGSDDSVRARLSEIAALSSRVKAAG